MILDNLSNGNFSEKYSIAPDRNAFKTASLVFLPLSKSFISVLFAAPIDIAASPTPFPKAAAAKESSDVAAASYVNLKTGLSILSENLCRSAAAVFCT